jgi:hypothetical protein
MRMHSGIPAWSEAKQDYGIQPTGIDITLGTGHAGLWYDSLASSGENAKGFGIRVGIRWGRTWFQFPKFWRARWWRGELPPNKATDWYQGQLPFFAGPFVSLCFFGLFNGYVGLKYNGWQRDDWLLTSATFRTPTHR